MTKFAKRLRELREEKDYSQRHMARELGISKTTYWKYELGAFEPNHTMTTKIAEFFDVTTDYLLGRTEI